MDWTRNRSMAGAAILLAVLPLPPSDTGRAPGGAGGGQRAAAPEGPSAEEAAEGPREERGIAAPAAPRIEIQKIHDGLAVVRIAGISTTVLAGPDGVLVVDPGLEEAGPFLRKAIGGLGWGEVRTVIDTHWHFDHAGGNKVFGREAAILASGETREWLSGDQILLGSPQPASPPFARPEAVAGPTRAVPGYAEEVILKAAPGGHTGGDLLVHFTKSGVLAIGDIVFAGQFPFIDVDHGGSVEGLADILRIITEGFPKETKIVPGHGPLLTMEDLVAYRRMVLETTEVVRREMARGRSLEEMKEAAILAEWGQWDGSFTQNDWIEFIHRSLKGGG